MSFISAIVDFLIVAFSIFIAIRTFQKLNERTKKEMEKIMKKEKEEAEQSEKEEPTIKLCPHCFSEIHIKATRCPHCTSELVEKETEQ